MCIGSYIKLTTGQIGPIRVHRQDFVLGKAKVGNIFIISLFFVNLKFSNNMLYRKFWKFHQ